MQEIADHVYVETAYPGVTLGAISWGQGLILIDAPLRPDDIRLWRATLANQSIGIDRLLVNLDEHFDRTIGSRQIECMVAGHEKLNQLFKDRPITFKSQTVETGADWELQNGLGSIRWAPPEISFSHRFEINWDEHPIILEYHPGPSACSIWVELPYQKIVFVGDTVVPNAPPFLASADIPAWMELLKLLLTPRFQDFKIISGRGGEVDRDEVKNQLKFFDKVEHQFQRITEKNNIHEEVEKAARTLLKNFDFNPYMESHYLLRLSWGLQQYLKSNPRS
ncbi:MAG: MBL fold metallo-hydrolase [Chloroflexi bacterium]|nr:MBL fold metallo-hydrolase [Chloroflexota bacterium]